MLDMQLVPYRGFANPPGAGKPPPATQTKRAAFFHEVRRALGIELPGIDPDSSRRRHSQPALKKDHVAQRDQSGAMFGRDRGRSAIYKRIPDREQGSELFMGEFFMGEFFRCCGHNVSMDRFGNPACSILIKPRNKGRLSWPPLSL